MGIFIDTGSRLYNIYLFGHLAYHMHSDALLIGQIINVYTPNVYNSVFSNISHRRKRSVRIHMVQVHVVVLHAIFVSLY